MALFRTLRQNSSIFLSILLGLCSSYIVSQYMNETCQETFSNLSLNKLISEEYQPMINIAGKPQKAKKVPKNLIRPRYYSTELGIRQKILMGVLTSEKTVRSLALAVNRTSLPYLNKIMFFLDAVGAENAKASELKLPGIIGFKDTKEVLKPFHVIKYLTDNFLDEFDLFFLTKDTTYVNAKELETIVKKISTSESIHAGAQLSEENSAFCSFDGGLLLSNSVLRKMQTSLDWCVKNSFSDSHDTNVGRCILHASQLPCTQNIQDFNLKSVILKPEDEKNFENFNVGNALTYHPITNPDIFYKLHLIFSKKRLIELGAELDELEKKYDKKESPWPPGSYPPKTPPSRFDLIPWQLFDLEKLYLPSDFQNYKPLSGLDRQDILNVLNKSVDWVMSRYPGNFHFRRLVNGYRRFDPSRGLDYILDLSFKDNSGHEVIKRIEVSKPLGKVELLSMPYVTENTRIFILLPLLSDEKIQGDQLMRKYSQTCSQTELTFLILVLLYEPSAPGKGHQADVFKEVKTLANELSAKKHRDCKITWISIRLPEVENKTKEDHLIYFAMMDLVSKKLIPESLVLLTEPNIDLRTDYLNRVRMGTVMKNQIYCPIPFTEFSPEIVYKNVSLRNPVLEIHKNSGRFDVNNNRHISFYLSDYLNARKKHSNYLPTVQADKDISKLFLSYRTSSEKNKVSSLLDLFSREKLNILRTTEPALRLFRHECLRTNASPNGPTEFGRCSSPMGTRSQLGQIILDYKDKLRNL